MSVLVLPPHAARKGQPISAAAVSLPRLGVTFSAYLTLSACPAESARSWQEVVRHSPSAPLPLGPGVGWEDSVDWSLPPQ